MSKKTSPGDGSGSSGEAAARLHRQQLVRRHGSTLRLDLEAGLLAQGVERADGRRPSTAVAAGSARERASRRRRRRRAGLELGPPDARDQRQVIRRPPRLVALAPVAAERRTAATGTARSARRPRRPPPSDARRAPEVAAELAHTQRLAQARAELDVREARRTALDALDGLAVEAELQRVRRLGLDARELRVDRLVRPVAELRRLVDALQEVGDAAPVVEGEQPLEMTSAPARISSSVRVPASRCRRPTRPRRPRVRPPSASCR